MRIAVGAAVACALLAASGLAFARGTAQSQALIDSTVRFLQESQRRDGGFAAPGEQPSQSVNAWVAYALAASGINPQDQARCGTDLYAFLAGHFQAGVEGELAWPQIATTAFERELMVVDTAGGEPHDFAGYDLVKEILDRQRDDGSFPYTPGGRGEANDTIFAILALSPVQEPAAEAAVQQAAVAVVEEQNEDGGWYFSGRNAESETDMTGAALQALVAAGPPPAEPQRHAYEEAERNGLRYLRESQLPDGGFPALPKRERESNVASTAWAVQGIWATGGNPETWTAGPDAREPLDYMESMQQPDGHIRWRASQDLNGIWMTAYVTPAFAGQVLPPPRVPRSDHAATEASAAACLEPGEGGEGGKGTGVLTGGGGSGAEPFSRPKPQSAGKTPGGARRLSRHHTRRARDHSRVRRGANVHQPTGTESAEARDSREAALAVRLGHAGGGAPAKRDAGGAAIAAGNGGEPGGKDGGGNGLAATTPLPVSPDAGATGGRREVSGTLIGTGLGHNSPLAFGAPGLRGAAEGSGGGEERLALAIGLAALLAALGGAAWERLRGTAFA